MPGLTTAKFRNGWWWKCRKDREGIGEKWRRWPRKETLVGSHHISPGRKTGLERRAKDAAKMAVSVEKKGAQAQRHQEA